MNENLKIVHREKKPQGERCSVRRFGLESAEKALAFHLSFPEYSVTPLANLSCLSEELGLGAIFVKDESYRFGLNAFKVLGGSYAIGNILASRLGEDMSSMSFERLSGNDVRAVLGDITFVTATDGNHGRGVAWTASRLCQKSVVYMPKGTSPERLLNIRKLGSDASITELNYDGAVGLASENAKKYGWIVVQDTAWNGYEDVPIWIMEGYTTMALEAVRQLNGVRPTHVFLQAGVGSMAAAVCGFLAEYYRDDCPVITVVEPNQADCFYQSALANDGKRRFVTGEMHTIMAGLACGEPSTIAWEILNDYADNFVTMPDWVAAKGMRVLANPVGNDTKVVSGESGASTLGLLATVMQNDRFAFLRKTLSLDRSSRVLLFSTEGATDREHYRRVVWDGLHPSE